DDHVSGAVVLRALGTWQEYETAKRQHVDAGPAGDFVGTRQLGVAVDVEMPAAARCEGFGEHLDVEAVEELPHLRDVAAVARIDIDTRNTAPGPGHDSV